MLRFWLPLAVVLGLAWPAWGQSESTPFGAAHRQVADCPGSMNGRLNELCRDTDDGSLWWCPISDCDAANWVQVGGGTGFAHLSSSDCTALTDTQDTICRDTDDGLLYWCSTATCAGAGWVAVGGSAEGFISAAVCAAATGDELDACWEGDTSTLWVCTLPTCTGAGWSQVSDPGGGQFGIVDGRMTEETLAALGGLRSLRAARAMPTYFFSSSQDPTGQLGLGDDDNIEFGCSRRAPCATVSRAMFLMGGGGAHVVLDEDVWDSQAELGAGFKGTFFAPTSCTDSGQVCSLMSGIDPTGQLPIIDCSIIPGGGDGGVLHRSPTKHLIQIAPPQPVGWYGFENIEFRASSDISTCGQGVIAAVSDNAKMILLNVKYENVPRTSALAFVGAYEGARAVLINLSYTGAPSTGASTIGSSVVDIRGGQTVMVQTDPLHTPNQDNARDSIPIMAETSGEFWLIGPSIVSENDAVSGGLASSGVRAELRHNGLVSASPFAVDFGLHLARVHLHGAKYSEEQGGILLMGSKTTAQGGGDMEVDLFRVSLSDNHTAFLAPTGGITGESSDGITHEVIGRCILIDDQASPTPGRDMLDIRDNAEAKISFDLEGLYDLYQPPFTPPLEPIARISGVDYNDVADIQTDFWPDFFRLNSIDLDGPNGNGRAFGSTLPEAGLCRNPDCRLTCTTRWLRDFDNIVIPEAILGSKITGIDFGRPSALPQNLGGR